MAELSPVNSTTPVVKDSDKGNLKTAKVSYSIDEGKKNSFNVPVGTRLGTIICKNGETVFGPNSKQELTDESNNVILGHCYNIDTDTDIGKITPTQAKLFDLVRKKDGNPDFTKKDLEELNLLLKSEPGAFHDYIEQPFHGKCRLGFNQPNFRPDLSEGIAPTFLSLGIYNREAKKEEGILFDLPKNH